MSPVADDDFGLRHRRSRDVDNDAAMSSPMSPGNQQVGSVSLHDRDSVSPLLHATSRRASHSEAQRPGSMNSSMAARQAALNAGLSIDTSRALRTRFGHATSPDSPTGNASSGILKRSAMSPTSASPVTRERGYSLRRVLFARNVNAGEHAGIELVEAEPSSQREAEQHGLENNTGSLERKKSWTSVQITPVAEDPSQELPTRPASKEKKGFGTLSLPNYETWVSQRQSNSALSKLYRNYKALKKKILRTNELPPSKNGRQLYLDLEHGSPLLDERTNREHIGNGVRSSRYTLWNFFPRQVIFQFGKIANFYFLIISILQMIPGLSTTGSYTTIIPLLIFINISMAKEGYDDLRRHKLDKAENNTPANVLRVPKPYGDVKFDEVTTSQLWHETRWQDIKVCDVVRLKRDEAVPADIVLLHSEGLNGVAFIETMALDGETNLKAKQAPAILAKKCRDTEGLINCKAHIVVEDPNLDLYNFDGKVTVDGETLPITSGEVVYRGSIIRNTPSVIGIVINTGEECKIRMNANKNPRIKSPHLQAGTNRVVAIIVLFVMCLAAFMTIAYQVWRKSTESKSWYLIDAAVSAGPILTSFIIMFNTMVPLSLYVSMEIIKVGQLLLMHDINMYDPVSDTPMEAHTSTINEELGQINYIFSDKTGTLTDNVMRFRKLSVAGTAWLHDFDLQRESEKSVAEEEMKPRKWKGKGVFRKRREVEQPDTPTLETASEMVGRSNSQRSTATQWKSTARPAKGQLEHRTQDLLMYLQRKPHGVFARKSRFFLLSLALCHTCLPEAQKDGSIDFQAASPDELALVRAAQDLGYMVIDRAAQTITLKSRPNGPQSAAETVETYEVLDVIEFSSKRKRMSIIVRFPDGRRCIFCKGADSVVMERLKHAQLALQKVAQVEHRASIRKSLEAESALERMSETGSPKVSMERTSMSARRSHGGIGRSISLSRNRSPARDQVDSWLRQRERDVDLTSVDNPGAYVSPRTSLDPRRSTASVDPFVYDADYYEDMVDEALAMNESAIFERCFQHVDDFATEGLRTLLYGYKFLDEQEYLGWKKLYHDASTSLVNRQELIETAGEIIEQDFELAGATAIEDKLQKGVPETIDKLRRANIKIWMLTGDKRETAINIGQSCRLIKDYSNVVILDHEIGNVEQVMATSLLDLQRGGIPHTVIVIDGQTLNDIESNGALSLLFFDLAILADSVIICRSSPSQKAWAVNRVRTKVKGAVTLAIGDGANDVGMIQAANVGIGISSSKEGNQAARVSDYSIAQFRFLGRLLLVHGRWNYERTVLYCLSTFWKEAMFYMVQAFYQHSSGFSGTSLYESSSLSMFNTLFTSLPVIALGIFLQRLSASTLEAVPELYSTVRTFSLKMYLGWMALAVVEAMIIYECSCGIYGLGHRDNIDLFAMGDLAFTGCIVFISTKLLVLEMHNKTYVPAIAWFLSVGGWFLWNLLLNSLYSAKNSGEYDVRGGFISRFGRDVTWWLTAIVMISACVCLELVVSGIQKCFWPTDVDIFQELEQDPVIGKRFRDAAEGIDCGAVDEMDDDTIKEQDVQRILDSRDDEFMNTAASKRSMDILSV